MFFYYETSRYFFSLFQAKFMRFANSTNSTSAAQADEDRCSAPTGSVWRHAADVPTTDTASLAISLRAAGSPNPYRLNESCQALLSEQLMQFFICKANVPLNEARWMKSNVGNWTGKLNVELVFLGVQEENAFFLRVYIWMWIFSPTSNPEWEPHCRSPYWCSSSILLGKGPDTIFFCCEGGHRKIFFTTGRRLCFEQNILQLTAVFPFCKMMQERVNTCQFLPKFTRNYAKMSTNKPPFRL